MENPVYQIKEPLVISAFYSFFKMYYDKNYRFDGEIHDFWECVYVLEGSICASGDDRVYDLAKGDIIFHKPMEMHKFNVTDDKGATLLIFSYKMDGKAINLLKNKVFSLNDAEREIMSELLEFAKPRKRKTDNNVIYEYLETSGLYLQRLSAYLYQLFLSLADGGSESETLETSETQSFKKAVDLMNICISRPLSVTDIAKHCALSESGLKRLFKKYAGMSVHKYFIKLRLKTALALLESGKSVTEVAERLDFSSQSYFSVAFKRETGKNPSDIKNNGS